MFSHSLSCLMTLLIVSFADENAEGKEFLFTAGGNVN
jgi:hypothetical protein